MKNPMVLQLTILKRWIFRLMKLCIKGGLIVCGLCLFLIAATGAMDELSTDRFCSQCHVMGPYADSFKRSVHGGRNRVGSVVHCVDCHEPATGTPSRLFVKSTIGIPNLMLNMTKDTAELSQRLGQQKMPNTYTYNSGCRNCHQILNPPQISSGGRIAHRAFLLGNTQKTCIDCHPHVGHQSALESNQITQK